MHYDPVIIIGAPRSGTNMLRDVLVKLPNCATWPCDEINYVWRHGNVRYPSDVFPTSLASTKLKRSVSKQFAWVANKYQSGIVVEKTCANSLRVGFVHALVPNAKFIFIRRNGLDVVGSAMKRWSAPLDLSYLASKARFVPKVDLPYYASRYFLNRVYRLFAKDARLAFWGPQLNNMNTLLETHQLDEVCALQWKHCVDLSANAFESIPAHQYIEVAYEEFVSNPIDQLQAITSHLEIECSQNNLLSAVSNVSDRSINKGIQSMSTEQLDRLGMLVGDTLARYGYV